MRLGRGKKLVSDKIEKNNFVTTGTKQRKPNENVKCSLKDADFNKLRSICTHRVKLSETLFVSEFTGFPESLTKDHQMYHGNKAQSLEIYDSTPSSVSKVDPDACVVDLSAIVRSQASVTCANTFRDFSTEIIKNISRLSNNSRRS